MKKNKQTEEIKSKENENVVGSQPSLVKILKNAYEILETLVIAFILAMIIRTYIIQPFYIPSQSMEDTLKVNDHVLANKFLYYFKEIERGDIIIFRWPKSKKFPTAYENRGQFVRIAWRLFLNTNLRWNDVSNWFEWYAPRDYIKRVIGLPGDWVSIRDGVVYINDKPLSEPYIKEPPMKDFEPTLVSDDHLFVMGDNRNNSSDSRYWGFVSIENIRGKAFFRYWPLYRVGIVR